MIANAKKNKNSNKNLKSIQAVLSDIILLECALVLSVHNNEHSTNRDVWFMNKWLLWSGSF